jgi:hypothetical protein
VGLLSASEQLSIAVSADESGFAQAAKHHGVSVYTARFAQQRIVGQMVAGLSEFERREIVYLGDQGMSYAELGQEYGVPLPSAVKRVRSLHKKEQAALDAILTQQEGFYDQVTTACEYIKVNYPLDYRIDKRGVRRSVRPGALTYSEVRRFSFLTNIDFAELLPQFRPMIRQALNLYMRTQEGHYHVNRYRRLDRLAAARGLDRYEFMSLYRRNWNSHPRWFPTWYDRVYSRAYLNQSAEYHEHCFKNTGRMSRLFTDRSECAAIHGHSTGDESGHFRWSPVSASPWKLREIMQDIAKMSTVDLRSLESYPARDVLEVTGDTCAAPDIPGRPHQHYLACK